MDRTRVIEPDTMIEREIVPESWMMRTLGRTDAERITATTDNAAAAA